MHYIVLYFNTDKINYVANYLILIEMIKKVYSVL